MAKKAKSETKKRVEQVASVARQDDGTIQITLTIGWNELQKEMEKQAVEMGKTIEVPGFRKGKAPLDQVMGHVSKDSLVEKTLQAILPKAFGEAINKNKIKPAMYPKFEIIKAEEGKDWQIRAISCEIGEIKLGKYKEAIRGALRAKSIWTPAGKADASQAGKPRQELDAQVSRQEKEQMAIEALLKSVKLELPSVLVNQEVESRLAALLERLEKLGLSLESYLSSVNKSAEKLREEYKKQAEETIKLELILNKIAEEEKIEVSEAEIEKFIEAAQGDPKLGKSLKSPRQKRMVGMILRKRKVLDSLMALT